MYRLLLLLSIYTLTNAGVIKTSNPCVGIVANFNLKTVTGKWHMVAIIPDKLFPDTDCFSSGTVEADKAKVRELGNETSEGTPNTSSEAIKGTIVRQRFYTERLFDLWAKSAKDINGCYQQDIMLLDISNPKYMIVNDVYKIETNDDDTMQLHLMDADDGSEPFLVHILKGRPISAIIYRKTQAVTQEQLKPVFEFMSKLRGPQALPKICQNTFQDSEALV